MRAAVMSGLVACLLIAADQLEPVQEVPPPPEPEAVQADQLEPAAESETSYSGETSLVVDNINLVQGDTGLAHVEGVSLKDYAIRENVKIAVYPATGIRPVPSVNPISKAVDIILLADKPGKYNLVFAMAREGRLIYLDAPINVEPKQ